MLYEWEKGTGLKLYEGYGQTETVSIDVDKYRVINNRDQDSYIKIVYRVIFTLNTWY